MVLPYAELMQLERRSRFSWTERDVIIYALSVRVPSDPLDLRKLNYVYEDKLSVLVDSRRDEDVVSFEATVVERDCKAISNGKAILSRAKLEGAAPGRGELQ